MPAKKKSGRKWTAAQRLTQSKKIKKTLRAKKNAHAIEEFKAAHAAKGTIGFRLHAWEDGIGESFRENVRAEIRKAVSAIIEEEVRSALS